MGFLINLWWLSVGHALADFVLQTDTMAKGKNRHRKPHSGPDGKYQPAWGYWLSAHALIHGGVVALVTGSVLLGVLESICHAMIDFGKGEDWYGFNADQTLHVGCKIIWAAV